MAAKMEKIKKIKKEDQKNLRVGIAGNINEDEDNLLTSDSSEISKIIKKTLKERGYYVKLFNFNNIEKVFNEIKSNNVDLIFNVCEKINNSSLLKPCAVALLDMLQIPHIGPDASILNLCMDKIRVKKLLTFHNIPTAKWDYAYAIDDEINKNLEFPLIVKPAHADNLFGVNNESVVIDQDGLKKQIKKMIIDLNSPALIEEYIDGDEYNISILGSEEEGDLKVLPLSRSIFKNMSDKQWHIYTHKTNREIDAIVDNNIIIQQPAKNINKKLETLITEIALDVYNIFDCKDYGSIKIKVDKYDNPYVLDLNPSPSLYYNECLSKVAKLTRMEYGDLLEEIINMAIKRYQQKPKI